MDTSVKLGEYDILLLNFISNMSSVEFLSTSEEGTKKEGESNS